MRPLARKHGRCSSARPLWQGAGGSDGAYQSVPTQQDAGAVLEETPQR